MAKPTSKPRPKPTSVHRPEHAVAAQLLRELRLASGLTQAEASAHVGLTQAGISELEKGVRGLDLLVVRDLALVYGADWPAVIVELDRRIAAGMKPAAALMKRKAPPKSPASPVRRRPQ
ncbi:helix-turn-helix domain-containing protein [Rhodanobacter sp. Si-c]|uniref:Helix-turn-helix domain-containing protein n=1 Tax=Rhodanobacter lycopersici TaxID=3162487 RepID=A0ABV3QEI8_9GAMM